MTGSSNVVKRRRTTCKTGCLTCKARKVKCDEGKPACGRCVGTGRTCEGYGIWGGGGNTYVERQGKSVPVPSGSSRRSCLRVRVPASCHTPDEELYLDWFYIRTVPKIPGLFPQDFWSILVRQASVIEPAILHATLTLSSAHKTTKANEVVLENSLVNSEKQESFMLQNYSKAIRHLQPHLTNKNRASTRIALIACAVFVCLEFLRGNFKTADTHLNNGMRVLQEICGNAHDGVLVLRATDATDEWIIETFQRLHLQVELFHRTHRRPAFILQHHKQTLAVTCTSFQSLREAWNELLHIFYKIVALKGNDHDCHSQGTDYASSAGDTESLPHQQYLLASLTHWHTTYITCAPHLHASEPTLVINAMILAYYNLAHILCSTALSHSELAYDAHTPRFLAILASAIHLWTRRPPPKVADRARFNMAHSIVDFGWVPPLYYTAFKCRVRRVRWHAVRLLEDSLHREGMWDCGIASRVMRKVVEIEEGGLCEGEGEGFKLDELLCVEEVGMPGVPVERRLERIKVNMGDEMGDGVVVDYVRAGKGSRWEQVVVSLGDRSSACA